MRSMLAAVGLLADDLLRDEPGGGATLERRALRLIALRAEDLQVLGGIRAAHGERDDVVVLDLEVGPAFDAAAAVAFEDDMLDLARDRRSRFAARPRSLRSLPP